MLLKLLSLPISAPVAGIRFCLNQVVEAAEQEWLDDTPVKEALLLLTLQLEEGQITDAEYREEEAVLLRRLREIRALKQGRSDQGDAAQPAVFSMQGGQFVVEVSSALCQSDDTAEPLANTSASEPAATAGPTRDE